MTVLLQLAKQLVVELSALIVLSVNQVLQNNEAGILIEGQLILLIQLIYYASWNVVKLQEGSHDRSKVQAHIPRELIQHLLLHHTQGFLR